MLTPSLSFLVCIGMAAYFLSQRKVAAAIVWAILAFVPFVNTVMALGGIIYLIFKAIQGK